MKTIFMIGILTTLSLFGASYGLYRYSMWNAKNADPEMLAELRAGAEAMQSSIIANQVDGVSYSPKKMVIDLNKHPNLRYLHATYKFAFQQRAPEDGVSDISITPNELIIQDEPGERNTVHFALLMVSDDLSFTAYCAAQGW